MLLKVTEDIFIFSGVLQESSCLLYFSSFDAHLIGKAYKASSIAEMHSGVGQKVFKHLPNQECPSGSYRSHACEIRQTPGGRRFKSYPRYSYLALFV